MHIVDSVSHEKVTSLYSRDFVIFPISSPSVWHTGRLETEK